MGPIEPRCAGTHHFAGSPHAAPRSPSLRAPARPIRTHRRPKRLLPCNPQAIALWHREELAPHGRYLPCLLDAAAATYKRRVKAKAAEAVLVSIDRGGLDARVMRGGTINVERLLFVGKVRASDARKVADDACGESLDQDDRRVG